MLVGTDKQGNALPDHNIVAQCVTFLVAGHETTSGLLSFTIAYLLKHPEVVARAHEEVDRVLGTDPSVPPTVAQVQQLGYIRQILDETLRLWPTAPAFTRQARETTTVGGWGPFSPGQSIIALTPMLHRLKDIWGDDAEEFNPDHFAPERRDSLPPNAFRPFGSGQRACIGRQFALQEATLVLGMLMQRFEFVDHANYQLKIKESLTLKPDGLTITIRPRAGRTWGATARPVAARRQPAHPRAGGGARRPARHPAAGALRLQPRRVGGHRLPDRPRRHRPRLHRPHRRARRRGRRAADRRRRRGRHLLLQRPAAGQRGEVRRVGRRRRDLGGRGALHRLRLRQPRLGRHLPGRADADRRRAGGARRDPGVPARRRRRAR